MPAQALEVLLLEDNEGDARYVREMVRDRPEVSLHRVERLAAGLQHLATCRVDAILLDLGLPDSRGLDTLRTVVEKCGSVPVVVLTGDDNDAVGGAAVRAGAQDYLAKGRLTEDGLLRSIRYAVERAVSQAKLRDSECWFATLFEANPTALVLIEKTGLTIRQANAAAAQLLGLPAEKLVGRVCRGFLCSAGEDCFCFQGPALAQSEGVLLRGDGGQVPVLRTVAPLQHGGADYLLASLSDLTEQKRAEGERVRLEAQLRGAQKMEAIGSLAGGVAHDFNNLLTVILGHVAFALEAVDETGPVRDDLLQIRAAGESAAGLTRQLLAFGRKQLLQPKLLDLNQLISEFEKMLRRILGEDLELVLVLERDLHRIMADPGQLEQVLMNLVVNARDAMPGGGRLVIETRNAELDEAFALEHPGVAPGAFASLSISDSGCGMDQETQQRIFEPFFTTKERGKGTGLGLSTVYGIVKQSGGTIWVQSEPGRGTTFRVYFPCEPSAVRIGSGEQAAATCPRGDETILVVEDEEVLLRLAKRILVTAGYTVLTAANGVEALRVGEAHRGELHLVLTDVVMPQMGGRAMAERLAALCPGLKVLYVSGFADSQLGTEDVLEAGLQFLAKPFTSVSLTRKVREVLDG